MRTRTIIPQEINLLNDGINVGSVACRLHRYFSVPVATKSNPLGFGLGACDGFDVNKDGYPGILP
jgi:hypothetical protein